MALLVAVVAVAIGVVVVAVGVMMYARRRGQQDAEEEDSGAPPSSWHSHWFGQQDAEEEDYGAPPSSSHDRRWKPSTTSMSEYEIQRIAASGGDATRACGAREELLRRRGR